jgi:hypothetical protein
MEARIVLALARKASAGLGWRRFVPPALLACALGGCLLDQPPHPSDRELLADFHHHRADIERVAAMARADAQLERISDDWFRDSAGTNYYEVVAGRLLSATRWNEYRRLFRALHLEAGISIEGGDIFFERSARGITVAGSGKGYALLAKPPDPDALSQSLDRIDGNPAADRDKAIWFRHIEGPWYLFFEPR